MLDHIRDFYIKCHKLNKNCCLNKNNWYKRQKSSINSVQSIKFGVDKENSNIDMLNKMLGKLWQKISIFLVIFPHYSLRQWQKGEDSQQCIHFMTSIPFHASNISELFGTYRSNRPFCIKLWWLLSYNRICSKLIPFRYCYVLVKFLWSMENEWQNVNGQ